LVRELVLGRLILVSNRLPVTVRRGRDGVPALIRSSGGMVAALGPVHEAGMVSGLGILAIAWMPMLRLPSKRIGTCESRSQAVRTARTTLATQTPRSGPCFTICRKESGSAALSSPRTKK